MSNHRFCTCIFLTRELAIEDTDADVPGMVSLFQ
jgi:hypothetical protein